MRYQTGIQAENKACRFLKQQGLRLLVRNFKTRLSEIDLIMQDGVILVFVEVRYRRYVGPYSTPTQTVTPAKQKRLIRAALFYLQTIKKRKPFGARFDIIGIQGDGQIEWIKNAFEMK
jgi:putative endonuclease